MWLANVTVRANNCTLATSIVQPWNMMEPDRGQSMTQNALYVQNVTVETAETCSATLKLQVTLVNHTNAAENNLHVQLKEGSALDGSANANVPKGGSAVVTIVANAPVHWSGVVSLENGTGVAPSGITVNVRPTCT